MRSTAFVVSFIYGAGRIFASYHSLGGYLVVPLPLIGSPLNLYVFMNYAIITEGLTSYILFGAHINEVNSTWIARVSFIPFSMHVECGSS